jgi:hypothetical protein
MGLNYGAIGGRVECMKERRHELRGANYGCRSRQRKRMSSSVRLSRLREGP